MPVSASSRSDARWIASSSSSEIALVGSYGIRGWLNGRCCGSLERSWAARPPARRRWSAWPAVESISVIAGSPSVTSLTGEVEPGRLQLGVAVERVERLVTTEPGLLEAAERDRDVGGVERVHIDDPRAQRP